jgi:hypothetical protein
MEATQAVDAAELHIMPQLMGISNEISTGSGSDRVVFLPSLSLWERVRVRAYGPSTQLIFVVECHSPPLEQIRKIDLLKSPHPQPFSQREKGGKPARLNSAAGCRIIIQKAFSDG